MHDPAVQCGLDAGQAGPDGAQLAAQFGAFHSFAVVLQPAQTDCEKVDLVPGEGAELVDFQADRRVGREPWAGRLVGQAGKRLAFAVQAQQRQVERIAQAGPGDQAHVRPQHRQRLGELATFQVWQRLALQAAQAFAPGHQLAGPPLGGDGQVDHQLAVTETIVIVELQLQQRVLAPLAIKVDDQPVGHHRAQFAHPHQAAAQARVVDDQALDPPEPRMGPQCMTCRQGFCAQRLQLEVLWQQGHALVPADRVRYA